MATLVDVSDVAENCPGESKRGKPPAVVALMLPIRVVMLSVLSAFTAGLWLPYWIGFLLYGRAPSVPRLSQIWRYIWLPWTVQPPAPGLPLPYRAWLSLSAIRKLLVMPLWGCAWYLDELLYGRELDAVEIQKPVFLISAARSGSTQLSHYLEKDPKFVGPIMLQTVFPYRWLWKLTAATIGKRVDKEAIREKIKSQMPTEFLERHEADPFAMDTFEVLYYTTQLNTLSPLLGPKQGLIEFSFTEINETTRTQWEIDFPNYVERLGRKVLLDAQQSGHPGPQMFVKGHCLAAADPLAERFPDATFITIVREPVSRIRSGINFLRANTLDPTLPPVPWSWIALVACDSEAGYGDREMQWYSAPDGPSRCVVRFTDYLKDLPATITSIYETLGRPVPDEVPTVHAERDRTNYSVNRTLSELGIDEAVLRERCADYIAWAQG